jgi:hypothetical protein
MSFLATHVDPLSKPSVLLEVKKTLSVWSAGAKISINSSPPLESEEEAAG